MDIIDPHDIAEKENWRRWNDVDPELFACMLPGWDELTLKRIDIRGDRNNHEIYTLSEDKYYLVHYSSRWYLGRAHRSYNDRNSWNMWLGSFSPGVRNCNIVFEINLPDIQKNPSGQLPVPRSRWDMDDNEDS